MIYSCDRRVRYGSLRQHGGRIRLPLSLRQVGHELRKGYRRLRAGVHRGFFRRLPDSAEERAQKVGEYH